MWWDELSAAQGTLISACISLVASGLTGTALALSQQRHKARLEYENSLALEKVKKELLLDSSRDKARLDYEYEAIKRLYHEVEPLLFQLCDHASRARYRVLSLGRSANNGSLEEPHSWTRTDPYYLRSTIYRLVAPLAAFRILQRKVTHVDLGLDQFIGTAYRISEMAYYAFADDFVLAAGPKGCTASLNYRPNVPDWNAKRLEDPKVYHRQGFPIGVLDQILELCIKKEGSQLIVMTYGEFESEVCKTQTFQLALDVFLAFHPTERPVLWRILVAQYYLYGILEHVIENRSSTNLLEYFNGLILGLDVQPTSRRYEDKSHFPNIAASFGDPHVLEVVQPYVVERIKDHYERLALTQKMVSHLNKLP